MKAWLKRNEIELRITLCPAMRVMDWANLKESKEDAPF